MIDNEPTVRLAAFAAVFTTMALLELLLPKREQRFNRSIRWPGNLALTVLNTVIVRLIFPTAAVGLALSRPEHGLLGALELNAALSAGIALLVLDLTIYIQHFALHRIPFFWRLHRMHHTDNDIDVTTAVRFHPLEILLSMLIKLAVIWIIGAPAIAVLLFELLLSSSSLFNHANISLPAGLDRTLRALIVTPDMHRVHHSIDSAEHNSNFGFNLSIWDRLFGTYTAQPKLGHMNMKIGLRDTQVIGEQKLNRMLMQPFSTTGQN